MSALSAVLAEARAGGTVENIAARLGLASDLVGSMIDQGERLGLIGFAAPDCGGCGGVSVTRVGVVRASAGPAPAGCAGCPLAGPS